MVHSVDTVLAGCVPAREEELELQPPAEADDHEARNITGSSVVPVGQQFAVCRNITESSGVPVGQQFTVLVHSVDALHAGCIPTGEEKLELEPSAEADEHGVRNITGSSGVLVELLGGGNPLPIDAPGYSDLGDSLRYAGYHHFCINVPDIEKAVADLRARNVEIVTEPFKLDAISRKLAFFADPSGNLIELAEIVP